MEDWAMGQAASQDSGGDEPPSMLVAPLPWRFSDGEPVTSLNSRFRVNAMYTNRTSSVVECLWINFKGEEVSYGKIQPGETQLLFTFLTHPWVFRSPKHGPGQLLVNGSAIAWPSTTRTFADVVEAPLLEWSPATHASDYKRRAPRFAREVQELLRAYHALRKGVSRRTSSGGGTHDCSGAACHHGHTQQQAACGGCCGGTLRRWRGRVSEDAAHGSCVPAARASGGGGGGADAVPPTADAAAEGSPLECMPYDILLRIIALMAPPLHVIAGLQKDAMEIMPPGIEPGAGPVARLAARLLGPSPPLAPDVGPEAWFAAAAAAAGGDQVGGPLAAGAAAGLALHPVAQQLHAGGMAAQQALGDAEGAAGGPAPVAASPQDVADLVRYAEAVVLANTALTRAAAMTRAQDAQLPELRAFIAAQQAALAAAHQRQGGGREEAQAEGGAEEEEGMAGAEGDGDDEAEEHEYVEQE